MERDGRRGGCCLERCRPHHSRESDRAASRFGVSAFENFLLLGKGTLDQFGELFLVPRSMLQPLREFNNGEHAEGVSAEPLDGLLVHSHGSMAEQSMSIGEAHDPSVNRVHGVAAIDHGSDGAELIDEFLPALGVHVMA